MLHIFLNKLRGSPTPEWIFPLYEIILYSINTASSAILQSVQQKTKRCANYNAVCTAGNEMQQMQYSS